MKTLAVVALAASMTATTAMAETLTMQSVYPSSLPLLGDSGMRLTEQVSTLTGGKLELEFNEPGAIVGGNEMWDGLEDQERFAIETACAANVTYTMARGEAEQLEPLADLEAAGVTVHTWNDEMMGAFKGAWEEVVAENSKTDPDFARAWKSLSEFRDNFAKWSDLAYIK